MSKKINRALLQDILKQGDGIKTVSGEAVDWVISVAEEAARNLAASGRRTPSGRLMAPRMDPGLMARHAVAATPGAAQAAKAGIELADEPGVSPVPGDHGEEWTNYNDWQAEVRQGKTKLKFEEWQAARKEKT